MSARRTVGYVATLSAIVALSTFAGFWAYGDFLSPKARRWREATRTHERPLSAAGAGLVEGDAVKALRPVRSTLGADGALSFVSMPSFRPWYAVTLRLGDQDAEGAIVGVGKGPGSTNLTFSQVLNFKMPKGEYLKLVRRLGSLTDGWAGSPDEGCYDGTAVAFELTRTGHSTSGAGNAACDRHYAAVRGTIEATLFRFAPKPVAP